MKTQRDTLVGGNGSQPDPRQFNFVTGAEFRELWDGSVTLEGGMNSAVLPNVIQRNQYAFGANLTARGGFTRTRPSLKRLALTYEPSSIQTAFVTGLFQGAEMYQPDTGNAFMIASVAGRIYKIGFSDSSPIAVVSDITPATANPATTQQVWMYQAEKWLIIQDGNSPPIIFDGASCVRAEDFPLGVPIGTVGIYAIGRIWQATGDGLTYVAGNLVYQNGNRSDVLNFDDNTFLNGGGSFGVPAKAGNIVAMQVSPQMDASIAAGPLIIGCRNLVFSVDAPFDRTSWQDLASPMQTVNLFNYGPTSQWSFSQINGDILYRALDGIRSTILSRRDWHSWVNRPISSEMNRVLNQDDENLLTYSSSVVFDNRYLCTVAPRAIFGHGTIHRGLVALDFEIISTIGSLSHAAYDGLWTGLNILKIVKGSFGTNERCYVTALDASNSLMIWELESKGEFDNDGNQDVRIKSVMETRSYDFGTPFQMKSLETAEIYVRDIQGTVNFKVWYRADLDECWKFWAQWDECAKIETCPDDFTGVCYSPKNYKPQYRSRMMLPTPLDECNEAVGKLKNWGFQFQLRIEVTGSATILSVRTKAKEQPMDNTYGECRTACDE